MSPAGNLPCSNILQSFQQVLHSSDACIILNYIEDSATFLINFTGQQTDKEHILKELLLKFHEDQGYLSAISNSSESPLDIPVLYDNVMHASSQWPQIPVVDFQSLPETTNTCIYLIKYNS